MALIAAYLNAGVILVVTASVATGIIIYNLPLALPPYPLLPFSQSLISLMVSVDVKHHVYLLLFHRGTDICFRGNDNNAFESDVQPEQTSHSAPKCDNLCPVRA